MSPEISIVITVYNEEDNVEPLIAEIAEVLADKINYQLLVVDDGSSDQTLAKLTALHARYPQLTVVQQAKNSGKSIALINGIKAAKADTIVTMDGDGQDDPRGILSFVQYFQAHSSAPALLISGVRINRQDDFIKKISSRIANKFRNALLKDDCEDTGCGLKILSRELFLQLPHFNHCHRFLPALFKRQGIQTLYLPVNHRARWFGQSKSGVFNRLWVGIVDVLGVWWLLRRAC